MTFVCSLKNGNTSHFQGYFYHIGKLASIKVSRFTERTIVLVILFFPWLMFHAMFWSEIDETKEMITKAIKGEE
jgi:hypothetical protein